MDAAEQRDPLEFFLHFEGTLPGDWPSLETLSSMCPGSLAIAAANKRLGNDYCARCDIRSECARAFAKRQDDLSYYEGCFGIEKDLRMVRQKCMGCHFNQDCERTITLIQQESAPAHTLAPSENVMPASKPSASAARALVPAAPVQHAAVPATSETTPAAENPSTSTAREEAPTARSSRPVTATLGGHTDAAYSFPVSKTDAETNAARWVSRSTEHLTEYLRKLFAHARPENGDRTAYLRPRTAICAISLELNRRGALLPRLRPVRRGKFVGAKPDSPDDALLANDLRFVDVHWLATHRENVFVGKWGKLLGSDGLNFSEASQFVSQPGAASKKAELLTLSKLDDAALFMIQTEETQKRWTALLKRKNNAVRDIRLAISRNHGRRKDDPEWLWNIFALDALLEGHRQSLVELASRVGGPSDVSVGKIARVQNWFAENKIT